MHDAGGHLAAFPKDKELAAIHAKT